MTVRRWSVGLSLLALIALGGVSGITSGHPEDLPSAEDSSDLDRFAAPAESLVVPPESLAAGAESLVVSPESLAAGAESLVVPPESLAARAESLVVSPESLVAAAGSLAAAPESLTVAAGRLATAAESLAAPAGSLAAAVDSQAVGQPAPPAVAPDSVQAADSLAVPAAAPGSADAADTLALRFPPSTDSLAVAGEDSLAAVATPGSPDSRASADMDFDLLDTYQMRDIFGFIAAWQARGADTTRIRPLSFAPLHLPSDEPLLQRLVRRARARRFVRDELGLRPEYFLSSDSIAVVMDARVDSLVDEGVVADGLFYRASRSGGMRLLPPSALPALQKRPMVVTEHSVDLDAGLITRTRLWRNSEVTRRVSEPYAAYLVHLTRRQGRTLWKKEIDRVMQEATVAGGRAGLVRISLPFELPPAMKSIFGEGTPNLSVRGSERISFGGRSQWFPHRPTTEFQRKPSKFPQLEMEQELNIQLKGTIGDKLDIDVDQASAATTPLANKIQIHYRGYEDEIIRRVDLGNTSLNLPGTEYVSYGGRHTGLFGINSEAQLGDVTLNLIISKEEGQTAEKSTSIRSQQEVKRIYDYEYIRNRFFFLDDPNVDAYDNDLYPQLGYVVDIDRTSVELWLDDGDGRTQEEFATTPGMAVLGLRSAIPTSADTVVTDTLYFERLELNRDFFLYIDERFENEELEVHPYIVVHRYLDERSTLAVTYHDDGIDQPVGGISDGVLYAKMIRPKDELVDPDMNSGEWGPTNALMLKNVYSLHPGAANWTEEGLPEASILREGFEMSIHYKGTVAGAEDPDEVAGTKIIRYVGLDYYEESDTGYLFGQDGRVDFGRWIDQGRGLIYFPDLEPFAPGSVGNLRGRPPPLSEWDLLPEEYRNRGIYERKTCVRGRESPQTADDWDWRFYIEVRYRTPVTELRIDAWDIIEGSEVVTVGSRRLVKDRDYRIDYQTGIIHLYDDAAVGENDEISVTYKHAGGFGTVSKTLIGAAARYAPEDSKVNFSTSWLYQRTGSPDRRPRLGTEPTRIAVGEVAAGYDTESTLLTRLLDRLPIVETRQPSRISLQGGFGISFPNPNTRNDLYIDDFEGVADDIFVRLNRLSWKAASIPVEVGGVDESERAGRRGELWWYTPYRSLREGDLNPTLDYQEANDYRTVMELQIWPYNGPLDGGLCPPESSWVGITQNLSRTSLDLTRARFLDLWINDFVDWDEFIADTTRRAGTMYVELGRISEDAMWQRRPIDCSTHEIIGGPLPPPNARLDSEDTSNDGELDLSDVSNEDTGLDNVLETDAASGPLLDDYGFSGDPETTYGADPELCEVYSEINGTEGNARLDTEDLDGDNSLSQENSYFQFRIDLADTSVVATDVDRDYAESQWNHSGWRRIRIPLSDPYVDEFVNEPSWEDIKHLRIWFTGMTPEQTGAWRGRRRIQIGAIEIRSNRWVAEELTDSNGVPVPTEEILANEEDFFPGVFNNKENSDVYAAPFAEHRDASQDHIREREQSLTLEVRNFQPGHVGRVHTPFLRDQDYTGYEFLEFWVNSTLPTESDAEFFLRLCKETNTDSTHYYEYRVPVPKVEDTNLRRGRWLPVKIRLSDLSDLKREGAADSVLVSAELPEGGTISMRGHPYLTKIGRITLGVINTGDEPIVNANIWIDELRLTHVYRDIDFGYRAQLRTELSDLGRFDISFKHIGADFASISSGGFRARKEEESNLTTSGNLSLDRFLPRSLKMSLPLSAQFSRTRRVPKYRTNDDLLVGDKPDDRDITQNTSQNYTLSIAREKAPRGLLRYTLDAFTINGSYRKTANTSPTARDTTITRTLTVGYSFPFGTWGDWRLYRNWRVRLLPTDFSVNVSRSWRDEARYRRQNADINQPYVLDDRRGVRSGGLTFKTGLRPIKEVTYSFSQSRDLMLRQRADWLGGINIGRETARNEDLNANYTLRLFRDWMEPRLTWRGGFQGTFNRQENVGGGSLQRVTNLTNSRSASVSSDLPLRRLLDAIGEIGAGSGDAEGESSESEDEETAEEQAARPARPTRDGRTSATMRAGDRAGGRGFLSGLLQLNRTSGSFTRTQQSTFSRVRGEPSVEYQLGFSLDPGVYRLSSSRESRSETRTIKLEADLKLLRDIGLTAGYDRGETETRATGNTTGKLETVWPDLDLRWGDLSRKLGFRRYVKTMKTNTRFSRRSTETNQGGAITKRETNASWSPMMDLTLSLESGMSFTLRVDHTSNRTEDLTGLGRTTDRNNTRFRLTGKKSLDIVREVTVPLTNAKQTIRTRLDLSLDVSFDINKQTSQQPGQKPQVMGDSRKLDFALHGSYQFSKSVTGRASITFGENADNKNRTRTSRYVGIHFSASFSF